MNDAPRPSNLPRLLLRARAETAPDGLWSAIAARAVTVRPRPRPAAAAAAALLGAMGYFAAAGVTAPASAPDGSSATAPAALPEALTFAVQPARIDRDEPVTGTLRLLQQLAAGRSR